MSLPPVTIPSFLAIMAHSDGENKRKRDEERGNEDDDDEERSRSLGSQDTWSEEEAETEVDDDFIVGDEVIISGKCSCHKLRRWLGELEQRLDRFEAKYRRLKQRLREECVV